MQFKAYAATVTGPRHQHLRQKNQDAVLIRVWRDQWLAVVSDGMGSRRHAEVGSHMAFLFLSFSSLFVFKLKNRNY